MSRKYTLNETYFDNIDTEEKAYWLGFIYADGNLYNNIMCISLAGRDHEHLMKLKAALNYGGPIYKFKSNFNSDVSKLQIGSRKIVMSLKNTGLIENKSHTQHPLFINNELENHFWRGVIDGDGDITKTNRNYNKLRLSGNIYTVNGFKDFIYRTTEINSGIIRPHGSIKRIEYNKQADIKTISNLLYEHSSVFLNRKYDLYVKNIKNYMSREMQKQFASGKQKSR